MSLDRKQKWVAVYPDIQQRAEPHKSFYAIVKEYKDSLKLTDLGITTSKFAQVDSKIKQEKMKKAGKKFISLIARKAGVK